MRVRTLLVVVMAGCSGPPDHSESNGSSCSGDVQCKSGHCAMGVCVNCSTNADCGAGMVCGSTPRVVGPPGGPFCVSADAGCASGQAQCPTGFSCYTCPSGYACHDPTGTCYASGPPPLPTCGQADLTNGYDAGEGAGPDLSGSACYSCGGCPRGSTCLCGASGIAGGLRCDDSPGPAIACFVSGGAGECRVFPGDCATNTQCTGTSTPYCSQSGKCVECLRDDHCPQTAGPMGCIAGRCYGCCPTTARCPPAAPMCVQGFCYACTTDGGCAGPDGGMSGGADAGFDGGFDAGRPDAGDAG